MDPEESANSAGCYQVNCIRAGIMKLEPVVSLMSIKSSMLGILLYSSWLTLITFFIF